MRIPELDLECDVLKCVRVVDRELEIVSQTFLDKLSEKTHIEYTRVHIVLPDFATPAGIVAYYDAFEEDEFECYSVELSNEEAEQLYQLED